MKNRRLGYLFTLLMVLVMALSACVAPTQAPAAGEPGEETAAETQPAATGAAEFHGAWPYQAPPTGHFNTFAPNALSLNIYWPLMEPPLFWYNRAPAEFAPLAGTSWEWADDTTIRVSLVEDAVWSDGSAFTSQDVVDTFDLGRLMNRPAWDYLESVEAVDEHTVEFNLTAPSTVAPRYILRIENIRASATYGEFAQRVRDLVEQGAAEDSDEWNQLRQEFTEFHPEDMVVLGPYKIDPNSITEAQLTMNKVDTSFMAGNVNFDRLIIYNGETPTVTPLVLSGDVDYATHGFPPATEMQFESEGIRIIRAPTFTGPALYFNHDIYPLNVKEFRQALAHAIDRAENGIVSLGASGVPPANMVGFSDNFVDNWLTEETKAQLNPYEFNRDTAEQILLDLGFSRNDQGNWLDDEGNALEFTLTAPAEFADWSAAAENLAQQLTDFGIPTAFQGVNFQQHPVDVRNGDFEIAIRDWGSNFPHPRFAYDVNLNSYNYTGGVDVGATVGPGMNFPLEQETEVLGAVDLGTMVQEAGLGGDEAEQQEVVNDLALAYNELLPQIPLWERYGNNPARETRVTGWPPEGDPVYVNGPYGDPFIFNLISEGTLQPVQ
jgi:peptide/nickel transport system substrate-binding protein